MSVLAWARAVNGMGGMGWAGHAAILRGRRWSRQLAPAPCPAYPVTPGARTLKHGTAVGWLVLTGIVALIVVGWAAYWPPAVMAPLLLVLVGGLGIGALRSGMDLSDPGSLGDGESGDNAGDDGDATD